MKRGAGGMDPARRSDRSKRRIREVRDKQELNGVLVW